MSPRLIPLDRFLLDQLIAQERDAVTAELIATEAYAQGVLAVPGLAFALLDGDTLVGAGGVVSHWRGRAEAWQLTSRHARPRQLVLGARLASRMLDAIQADPAFRRIEAYVQCGQRWALSFIKALGFEARCPLAAWDPAGRDVWLCERIRHPELSGAA